MSVSEAVVGEEHYFTATVRDLSNELLLMNMLPKSIAARLQAKENPINDGHENVSILFAGEPAEPPLHMLSQARGSMS